jgi:hypothetical protein
VMFAKELKDSESIGAMNCRLETLYIFQFY